MVERLQDFIVAVLKSRGSKILSKKMFLANEYRFAKKLEEYEALDLRIDKTLYDNVLLLWKSKTKQTISCQITVDGFDFTSLCCYCPKKKRVNGTVANRFRWNKKRKKIIAEEVTIIKELILVYDLHLEKFFF